MARNEPAATFLIRLLHTSLFIAVISATASARGNAVDVAMDLLMEQRYDSAAVVLDSILEHDPYNLDALYGKFTVYQTRLVDYEAYTADGGAFLQLIDSTLAIMAEHLARGGQEDSVRLLFRVGSLYGSRSVYLEKNGQLLQAVGPGLTSVSFLKKAVELDSGFAAAYLGIGAFDYYTSQKLGWMPFVKDRTDEGLERLRHATRAEFPYNYAAMNTLCWILIEREEYLAADSVAAYAQYRYPNNTLFLRIRAVAAGRRGAYDEALEAARRLRNISASRRPCNWSNLLTAFRVMTGGLQGKEQASEALAAAREAVALRLPDHALKIPYVRKHRDYLKSFIETHEREHASRE